jgi:hypothetical protein
MKQQYDKQQIAQLLSKFMAGETSVAEEQMLAQYFRTHEVDDEWAEYKEMFALFDNGQVDIEPESETSRQLNSADSDKLPKQPKTVREKPKIVPLRWLMAGIAASIALLLVFYLGRSTAEQPTLVAEKTAVIQDSVQPKHEAITPPVKTEENVVAQVTKQPVPQTARPAQPLATTNSESPSAADNLADCIARLEAEMNDLDDSVNSAQVERLIAADARLQQMVNRIVGKQVEQAMNELQKDSTANYVSF